jgi:hypothetical protein
MWLKTSSVLYVDYWILSHLDKIVTRIQVLILISTLYMVLCTIIPTSTFFDQRSKFDISFTLVFRISYLVLCTLYFVLRT